MKLLIDQNLSPKLVLYFERNFKEVKHVQELELDSVDDSKVMQFAKENNFTIVTKDSDFNELISIFGFPPKIIWIRGGNCSTKDVIALIKDNIIDIQSFENDRTNGILIIF